MRWECVDACVVVVANVNCSYGWSDVDLAGNFARSKLSDTSMIYMIFDCCLN